MRIYRAHNAPFDMWFHRYWLSRSSWLLFLPFGLCVTHHR